MTDEERDAVGSDLLHERINIRGEIEGIHAVLAEREKYLERRFAEVDRATILAMTELQRRLDVLNHAHEQAREKEATFVNKDLYEQAHQVLARRVSKAEVTLARVQVGAGLFGAAIVTIIVRLFFPG